jgi:hypothetical protein
LFTLGFTEDRGVGEGLEEAGGIFVGGMFDDAPCPALEMIFFLRADWAVARGTGISEGEDIAAKLEFCQG